MPQRNPAQPDALEAVEAAVLLSTGRTADELRGMSPSELRLLAESRHGEPLRITTRFPFVGRGNVLRDRLLSHQAVEEMLTEALREDESA